MAWNEPGGNKDPWNAGKGGGGGGAPDVDEILRRLRARFGGKGPRGSGRGLSFGFGGLIIVISVLWLFSGWYVVDETERAVVLRFGAYSRTTEPGLRWHMPWPIERVEIVKFTEVRESPDTAVMLTQDENIVELALRVQFRVSNAEDYVFNVNDPDATLRQATKSAVREVVGERTLDQVFEGRAEVAERTREILQGILDSYKTGLLVTQVNLTSASPPDAVQGAFLDAIKAREDQQRLKNEAESYANQRLPQARGAAARQIAEATAYRDQLVAQAEGEAARFTQLLTEYQKAPAVTRERLYLEAMGEVLSRTSKVVLGVDQSNPLLYLPLDQLMRQGGAEAPQVPYSSAPAAPADATSPDYRSRERGRR